MKDTEAERALERLEAMRDIRRPYERDWRDGAMHTLPRSGRVLDPRSSGKDEPKRNHLYDNFAVVAAEGGASVLEHGLTPKDQLWSTLTSGSEDLDEDDEVARYIEAVAREMMFYRYEDTAGYVTSMAECYLDLMIFGNCCLHIRPRPLSQGGGLSYRAINVGEMFVEDDDYGTVPRRARVFELTARQCVERLGDDAPSHAKKAMADGVPMTPIELVHFVDPREDYQKGLLDESGMPFLSRYICPKDKRVLRRGGYHEQPYVFARMRVRASELYGRSPILSVLDEIKGVNELRAQMIDAGNQLLNPAALLSDDLFDADLSPGARLFGAVDENGRPRAIPYNTGARLDVGREALEDAHKIIDEATFGIYRRVLMENPNMTATQSLLIAQVMGQMSAPVTGRLRKELLAPSGRREFGIMSRYQTQAAVQVFPEMPERLRAYLTKRRRPMELRFRSPMLEQASNEQGVATLRLIEGLAPLAQADPGIYNRILNQDAAGRVIARANGAPMEVLKTDAQRREDEERAAAERQAQMALEAAPVAASAARDLAQAQATEQAAAGAGVPQIPSGVF